MPNLAMALTPQERQANITIAIALVDHYGNEFGLGATKKHEMVKTIERESRFEFDIINPSDNHNGTDGSYGIAQFGIPTYEEFAVKIGITDTIDPSNIDSNKENQIRVMAYMFSIGKQTRWTAWRKQFGDLRPGI